MPPSPLYSPTLIAQQIAWLGRSIAEQVPPGPLAVIGVLRGAFVFMADLVRAIPREVTCDFVSVSSYGAGTTSSGAPRLLRDLAMDVRDQHVLLVEDIVDTGLTARFLLDHFATLGPRSLQLCTLLDKPSRRRVAVAPQFTGFTIDDVFVVGYGLDFDQRYRNLPYLGVLEESPGDVDQGNRP
jgi:hypoxanthine phosphoribosyltransferase